MKKELTLERTFNAPQTKVWQAWTDPAQVAQWWGPKGFSIPECHIDARPGGELYIVMLAGEGLGPMNGMRAPMGGKFLEVTPPETLVFTNQALDEHDGPLLSGQTRVTFAEENGSMNMVVHTSAEGDGPMVEQMLGGMEQGWQEQLDKLGEFLAR